MGKVLRNFDVKFLDSGFLNLGFRLTVAVALLCFGIQSFRMDATGPSLHAGRCAELRESGQ